VLTAFVDESGSVRLGCYLLGAVILDDIFLDDARYLMRDLRIGVDKLHWNAESAARRRKITEAIAELDHFSILAVGRGAGRRQERARHKCFEVLLPELEAYGVTRAVFERRGPRADRADLGKVEACHGRRLLTGRLSVVFDEPLREPLLWLADAVCGALFAEQAGDPTYATVLRNKLYAIDLDVD
jgi:hypothetical protein